MKLKARKEKKPVLKATIVRLDPALLRKVKIAAVRRDTTLQQLFTDAIKAYLDKEVEK